MNPGAPVIEKTGKTGELKIAFLLVPEETNVERFAGSYFCKYTTTVVLAPSCQAPTCERRSAPVKLKHVKGKFRKKQLIKFRQL